MAVCEILTKSTRLDSLSKVYSGSTQVKNKMEVPRFEQNAPNGGPNISVTSQGLDTSSR